MKNKNHTSQQGITLIALIITIIVMLILVGVTINVALNGGLFTKAEQATKETEEKAILEEMLAMMEITDEGKINAQAIVTKIQEKYTVEGSIPNITIIGNLGRYNYVVSETEIKIGIEKDNLTILKEELEGKLSQEIMDENGKFLNSDIILLESDETSGVVSYKGEKYLLKVGENDSGNVVIKSVERYNESDESGDEPENSATEIAYGTEGLAFIITSENELIVYANGTAYRGSDVGYSLYLGKINEHTKYTNHTIDNGLENSNKFIFNNDTVAYAVSVDGEKLSALLVSSTSISAPGDVLEKNTTLDIESIINSLE